VSPIEAIPVESAPNRSWPSDTFRALDPARTRQIAKRTDMGLPVSEEHIAETEAKFGRRLPEGFRELTKQSNGGATIRIGSGYFDVYAVWDPTDRKTMSRSANHVIRETESMYRDLGAFLPPGGIVLASNEGGDPLIQLPDDTLVIWSFRTHKVRPASPVDWASGIRR
jgi:hypothetical protein